MKITILNKKPIVIREFDKLSVNDNLSQSEWNDLRSFAVDNLHDKEGNYRPIFKATNKTLQAQNYVGVIQTSSGTVIEILPKIHKQGNDDETTKRAFYKMLRTWRRFKNASFHSESSINSLNNFPMLEVFIRLFIDNLVILSRRGLARQYVAVEENLPYLKGRLQFSSHIRHNIANQAMLYVEYDKFNANRPANRLIRSTIDQLLTITTLSKSKQLLRQLQADFDDVPQSKNHLADWNSHRIDRSMEHYKPVMQWVGLFLFNQGLTTYQGKHLNQCLLFPMEQIFEDYVAHCFKRYATEYNVRTQASSKYLARKEGGNDVFQLRPDIVLEKNNKTFVLDTKWKLINKPNIANYGISQADMYQMFAYGKKHKADCLMLIYPKSEYFTEAIVYDFEQTEDAPLKLYCMPFDCGKAPQDNIEYLMSNINQHHQISV